MLTTEKIHSLAARLLDSQKMKQCLARPHLLSACKFAESNRDCYKSAILQLILSDHRTPPSSFLYIRIKSYWEKSSSIVKKMKKKKKEKEEKIKNRASKAQRYVKISLANVLAEKNRDSYLQHLHYIFYLAIGSAKGRKPNHIMAVGEKLLRLSCFLLIVLWTIIFLNISSNGSSAFVTNKFRLQC